MWDPYGEIQTGQLPNGLTVHVATWPNRSWEYIGFVVHAGARDDKVGKEGLAHFVEHLVQHNIFGLTGRDFKDFFEACGGQAELATNFEGTKYSFFCPLEKSILRKSLDIFGKMILEARLVNQIEDQRQVIIGEFNNSFRIIKAYKIAKQDQEILYPGHWLSRFVTALGTPQSLKLIEPKDLQKFYDTYYNPANISVIAIGGLKPKEVLELFEKSPFAKEKQGKRNKVLDKLEAVPLPSKNILHRKGVDFFKTPLTTSSYFVRTVLPGTLNRFALRILQYMIYDYLHHEIREKNSWVYRVDTKRKAYQDIIEFEITIPDFMPELLPAVREVVDDCLQSIGNNQSLFDKNKDNRIKIIKMVDLSGKQFLDNVIDELVDLQKLTSLKEDLVSWQKLDIKDIQSILKYFKKKQQFIGILSP